MNEKQVKLLLLISSGALSIAGIIFLCISMFGYKNGWSLCTAMVCVMLAVLFNVIRCNMEKRNGEE